MKVTAALFLISLLALHCAGQGTEKAQSKDVVKSIRTITGTLVGFEIGDYQHVTMRTANGKRRSFFLGKPGLDYFLALNRTRRAVLTYHIVDTYIPENGGAMTIERVVAAKIGDQTFEQWWQEVNRQYSAEEIDRRYGPLVLKYKLN